jgi:hypothetical protein
MTYQTPELTALTPAISAIQDHRPSKMINTTEDVSLTESLVASYEEWD